MLPSLGLCLVLAGLVWVCVCVCVCVCACVGQGEGRRDGCIVAGGAVTIEWSGVRSASCMTVKGHALHCYTAFQRLARGYIGGSLEIGEQGAWFGEGKHKSPQ